MRKVKLTRQEKTIEENLLKGEYANVDKEELAAIVQALESRKKDAVLNIRVNSKDLENIKEKAHRLGIRYQTLISEFIHRIARAQ
jgi:predicted DNA binding CopG/RHH family protein